MNKTKNKTLANVVSSLLCANEMTYLAGDIPVDDETLVALILAEVPNLITAQRLALPPDDPKRLRMSRIRSWYNRCRRGPRHGADFLPACVSFRYYDGKRIPFKAQTNTRPLPPEKELDFFNEMMARNFPDELPTNHIKRVHVSKKNSPPQLGRMQTLLLRL